MSTKLFKTSVLTFFSSIKLFTIFQESSKYLSFNLVGNIELLRAFLYVFKSNVLIFVFILNPKSLNYKANS